MGNRSRYIATTTAVAVSARRRARLRRAAEGVREAILPTHRVDLPTEPVPPADDEAHAGGHRHLGRASGAGTGKRAPGRFGKRYAKGMGGRSRDR